jgi:hypothetical protein
MKRVRSLKSPGFGGNILSMVTAQTQIKINLPVSLKKHLETRAQRFGMPLAGYIRHLILKDVDQTDYPVYKASNRTEKAAQKAIKEINKSVGLDELFKRLDEG